MYSIVIIIIKIIAFFVFKIYILDPPIDWEPLIRGDDFEFGSELKFT